MADYGIWQLAKPSTKGSAKASACGENLTGLSKNKLLEIYNI
jgi:hypothetical protein